jgi:hypothetical protein
MMSITPGVRPVTGIVMLPAERNTMKAPIRAGDCVRIPDGRIGRVRNVGRGGCRVRVRRKTSQTHQFLMFAATDLRRVDCPKGWMSPEGYLLYLRVTLEKMRQRNRRRN